MDVAQLCVRVAKKCAEEEGDYEVKRPSSRYGGRSFVETIKWSDVDLDESCYVLKCFNVPTVPGTPAGLKATIAEQVQSGWISPKKGRQLMAYPDLQADEDLTSASDDYLAKILDKIVDGMTDGEDDPDSKDYIGKDSNPALDDDYTAPGPDDDLASALEMVNDYIQEGKVNCLSQYRLAMLDTFKQQCQALQQAAMPAMPQSPQGAPGGQPTAVPLPPPTSDLLPIGGGGPTA
jgi:hypothetical protein